MYFKGKSLRAIDTHFSRLRIFLDMIIYLIRNQLFREESLDSKAIIYVRQFLCVLYKHSNPDKDWLSIKAPTVGDGWLLL
jgi:hypothetical protein